MAISFSFTAKPNRNLKHIKLQTGPMYVYDTPLLTRHMSYGCWYYYSQNHFILTIMEHNM
jgi:hypothetical protein